MACQLICPNLRCRKILSVPDEARGKLVRCQHCRTMFRVPEPKRVAPAPAAAATAEEGDDQAPPKKKSA